MKLKAVSGSMLMLFMLSMLTLAFDIQQVKGQSTVIIRTDGSVDPPTAPIFTVDNITYTLTDNIDAPLGWWGIIVQRDNIVVDGAGYAIQQSTSQKLGGGILLSGRSNVTIKNVEINALDPYGMAGIRLDSSSNIIIYGNKITDNYSGIQVLRSTNNTIFGNSITKSYDSIKLVSSSHNNITENSITHNYNCIMLEGSSNNAISGNNMTNNHMVGIYLVTSSFNIVSGNNITENFGVDQYGVKLWGSSNNKFYHNNFIDNTHQVLVQSGSNNTWDDGYPSGGNYWSDYIGDDFYSGPYQNETGFDGIIDTPYVIDENSQDNYPLMVPWPLKYKVYSLTIDPVFYDNAGTTLIQPSSWTIKFPNGTTRTVSSPVTYNVTRPGNYSIVSIIWKGTEVIPETTPTTSPTSDMVWSPSINCLLPTSLPTSLSSSTSYFGFKVEINGNLTCNDVGLSGAPILLSYSVTNGESWSDISLINTDSDGGFSAVWMPSATGNYLVRAIWSGNATHPGATTIINLAVIPFKEQNVFSVTSNSTVSELAFNSTSRELSFTVTGPSGTTGYVNVYIAKSLIDNIADVKVYLDGDQLNYTATSLDDSWLLHFTYSHSTHKVNINLGLIPFIPPQLITPLSLGILAVALAVATVLLVFKIRRGTPPTILDGVFRESKQAQIATTIGTKRHKTKSMQGI